MNKTTVTSPFNPFDSRDLSPLLIAGHTVNRKTLPGTVRVVYSTMHGHQVAGSQLSYPTPDDCRRHMQRFVDEVHGRPRRGPSAIELARGTMTERVVQLVAVKPFSDAQLVAELVSSTAALSPILNRLVRSMRIVRTGKPGNYTYAAAPAPALPVPASASEVPTFISAQ